MLEDMWKGVKTRVNNFLEKKDDDLNLVIFTEECAKIIQIVSKIQRFGIDDFNPGMPRITNRDRLLTEMAHVLVMIDVITDEYDLDEEQLFKEIEKESQKLEFYGKSE